MKHTHKAIPAKSEIKGWTHCVTDSLCAANPQRKEAHGNIVRIDVCSCGSKRLTESNGGRSNYGPWSEETE